MVAQAGADLLNDAWGGADPRLAEVAARHRIGLVCSHAGGLPPRTRPHRPAYRDVVRELTAYVTDYAERAVVSGVSPSAILVDPAHDFGKNTWQSLEITRRLDELTGTGWPVLVAVADKDFIGETLTLPIDQRAEGTIATLAIAPARRPQFRVTTSRPLAPSSPPWLECKPRLSYPPRATPSRGRPAIMSAGQYRPFRP